MSEARGYTVEQKKQRALRERERSDKRKGITAKQRAEIEAEKAAKAALSPKERKARTQAIHYAAQKRRFERMKREEPEKLKAMRRKQWAAAYARNPQKAKDRAERCRQKRRAKDQDLFLEKNRLQYQRYIARLSTMDVEMIPPSLRRRIIRGKAIRLREAKRQNQARDRAVLSVQRALSANEVYAAAQKAVSRGYPPDMREDIVSDIVVAVLAGEIRVDEISAKARSFVTAHNRMAETYKTVSFDAPLTADGGSFHDFISEGMWS